MPVSDSIRFGRLPGLLVAAMLLASPLQAQEMLDGCQLVDGSLQCVPGVTADPQQQIRDLKTQIATDQMLEGAVQQQINNLQQLVLQGQASAGNLLQASLAADLLAGLPPTAFHWYRQPLGSSRWLLIQEASGPSYLLGQQDINSRVMLVVAVPGSQGSQRQMTPAVGPVSPGRP